jgi:hypothetical protein
LRSCFTAARVSTTARITVATLLYTLKVYVSSGLGEPPVSSGASAKRRPGFDQAPTTVV